MKFKLHYILVVLILVAVSLSGCTGEIEPKVVAPSPATMTPFSTPDNAIKAVKSETPAAKSSSIPVISKKPDAPGNAENNIELNVLKDRIICIDPGHGRPNHSARQEPVAPSGKILKAAFAYGTAGVSTKIPEYKLTMKVSAKLRDELLKSGAKVVMTRESNETNLGNIERAEIANKAKADLCIRIHADGSNNSNVAGISLLQPGNQYIKDKKLLSDSKMAAELVLESLIKATNAKSRGVVERNDLTGFNWSKVPVILVEMGFMTNPSEDRQLNSEAYQDKMVNGIMKGLTQYFSINPTN